MEENEIINEKSKPLEKMSVEELIEYKEEMTILLKKIDSEIASKKKSLDAAQKFFKR